MLRALCMDVAILYSAPFTLLGTAVLSRQDRTFVFHSSSSSSIAAVLSLTLLEELRGTCNHFVLFPTHQTVPDHPSRWSSVAHDGGVACIYICLQICTDLNGPDKQRFWFSENGIGTLASNNCIVAGMVSVYWCNAIENTSRIGN